MASKIVPGASEKAADGRSKQAKLQLRVQKLLNEKIGDEKACDAIIRAQIRKAIGLNGDPDTAAANFVYDRGYGRVVSVREVNYEGKTTMSLDDTFARALEQLGRRNLPPPTIDVTPDDSANEG